MRHLRYFVAVAEELHFGEAAKRLHIAQPPLSQQIRQLEKQLGVELLRRTKRRIELTEAGRAFLDEARRILERVEQSIRTAQRASRGEIGELTVGFEGFATYDVIPNILKIFRERFPDIHLQLKEMTTAQLIEALHNKDIQVGFLLSPIRDEELSFEPILEEFIIVALPENHPLSAKQKIPLRALKSEPFVLFPRHLGCGLYNQIIGLCQNADFTPNVIQEANQMQTILGLIATGLGISLVPESMKDLKREGVVYRELWQPMKKMELNVAWKRDNKSPVLQAFLKVAKEFTRRVSGKNIIKRRAG